MAYLAQELELYDGEEPDLVDFVSPADAIRAYQSGALDAVCVTANFVIEVMAEQPDQCVPLLINFSRGADTLIGKRPICSLDALRGTRIGLEDSPLGNYFLNRALQKAGLARDDITIVPIDVGMQWAYYDTDEFDAVVTYEPARSKMLEHGGCELFTSKNIPNEIVDVLLTRTSVVGEKNAQLSAFINGWLRAVEHYKKAPMENAALVCKREGLSPREFNDAMALVELCDLALNQQWLDPDDNLVGVLERIREETRRVGHRTFEGDLRALFEPGFVKEPRR